MSREDNIKKVIITVMRDFNQNNEETKEIVKKIERLEKALRSKQQQSIYEHPHNAQILKIEQELRHFKERKNDLRRIKNEEEPLIDNIFSILIRCENFSEEEIKFFNDLYNKKMINRTL